MKLYVCNQKNYDVIKVIHVSLIDDLLASSSVILNCAENHKLNEECNATDFSNIHLRSLLLLPKLLTLIYECQAAHVRSL